MCPLDRAHGADNLLIFEGRTAAHAIPGEHELQSHVRVDAVPKEVPGEGGDGGVIIVPPSIHPSGKPYRWRKGFAPDEIALAPLPDWLLVPRFGGSSQGHSLSYWRKLVREGVSEGRRNATVASFTGHLLWHGVDPDVALELMLAWNRVRCRPPLEDEEVIRTVRSVERTHTKGNDGH